MERMLTQHSSSSSRETIIDVTSSSVRGTYSLHDLLSITTQSGSIDITVTLENASATTPKPAELRLSTMSGSIRVKTPFSGIPDREYKSSVRTQSGSIDAQLVHGSQTNLTAHSGRIIAELLPYGPNTSRSDIKMETLSGSTDIKLHPLAGNASLPLRKLYADYQTRSGGMSIRYPATWEGTVVGGTISGGIDIDWDGLRIVKDRKGDGGREIEAVKGEGEGVLRFSDCSGGVRLRGDGEGWMDGVLVREGTLNAVEPGVREGVALVDQ